MNVVELANLPTKIEALHLPERQNGPKLWIKRDDQTGLELTGNKIRKLEYLMKDAMDKGATAIITCGAIGSNHARATAYASRKLGMEPYLLLAGREGTFPEGNHLLDLLAGAKIRFVSGKDYDLRRNEIMAAWGEELKEKGHIPYIIPEGASNAIGSMGYVAAMKEISEQGDYDAVVVTVGSAGTFAGLCYGQALYDLDTDIIGISISQPAERTKTQVLPCLFKELNDLYGKDLPIRGQDMVIVDGYQGLGYAKSRHEELAFIKDFIERTGIILDPVYTGKAMYGLYSLYTMGELDMYKNILFLHTGGAFGWTREKVKMLFD